MKVDGIDIVITLIYENKNVPPMNLQERPTPTIQTTKEASPHRSK